MSESDSTPTATFKNRRVGLILFGIVQLLLALGLFGLAGLQLLVLFAGEALAAASGGTPQLYAGSAVFYALMAAGMAWLGVGSVQCRRWARAMTLVLSWLGLVVGLLTSVVVVSVFRSLAATLKDQVGPEAAAGVAFAIGCMFLAIAFLYVIVPAAFVLFYRSPHVKATCDHLDPTPRWTDRLPLPLLAGGILLLSMAASFLAPAMGTPLPFFGKLLTGGPAWIYGVVSGGLALLLARGFFRRQHWAWLGTLLFVAASGLNAYLSLRGDGLARMYEAMRIPVEQIETIESIGIMTVMPWMIGVSVLLMLGFYLWLGRYFSERQPA